MRKPVMPSVAGLVLGGGSPIGDAARNNRAAPLRRKVLLSPGGLAVVLIAALVACGPSKPNGSEYLGSWEATWRTPGFESLYSCPLDISRNGESFLIKVEGEFSNGTICSSYRGIFILTPEGNLRGGPMESVLLSFDREKNQVALSFRGNVQYLKKR